jgi:hypothetical protein
VDGEMEVVEYVLNERFGMRTKEGPTEFRGLTLFEEIGKENTKMTHNIEFFGIDEITDKKSMTSLIQGAIEIHKQFIEAEQV